MNETDLIFQIETLELTEEPGLFLMDVESHEEGFIAKVFRHSGAEMVVGDPLAIICENECDIPHFVDITAEQARSYDGHPFLWQAYACK